LQKKTVDGSQIHPATGGAVGSPRKTANTRFEKGSRKAKRGVRRGRHEKKGRLDRWGLRRESKKKHSSSRGAQEGPWTQMERHLQRGKVRRGFGETVGFKKTNAAPFFKSPREEQRRGLVADQKHAKENRLRGKKQRQPPSEQNFFKGKRGGRRRVATLTQGKQTSTSTRISQSRARGSCQRKPKRRARGGGGNDKRRWPFAGGESSIRRQDKISDLKKRKHQGGCRERELSCRGSLGENVGGINTLSRRRKGPGHTDVEGLVLTNLREDPKIGVASRKLVGRHQSPAPRRRFVRTTRNGGLCHRRRILRRGESEPSPSTRKKKNREEKRRCSMVLHIRARLAA